MVVFPNPKINLGLQVVNRRSDGYHDIISVMVPVHNYHDILEIVPSTRPTKLNVDGNAVDCPEDDNLVMKAYRLMKTVCDIPEVEIFLHKIIPDGAGMGGGSADATFTLVALNRLFEVGLTDEQLCRLATKLGADCPFFVYNRPMLATGIGTTLSPIDVDLSAYTIKVVKPNVKVTTREAYAGIVARHPSVELKEAIKQPVEKWKDLIVNDFEKSLFVMYPQIAEVKSEFYKQGAIYASMTGSGSAVYGIFTS